MAKAAANKSQPERSILPSRDYRARPLNGLLFLILGVLIFISILSYSPDQNAVFTTKVQPNLVGSFGVSLAYHSLLLFGAVAWTLWIYSLWIGYMYLYGHGYRLNYARYLTALLSIICFSVLFNLFEVEFFGVIESGRLKNYLPHGFGGWTGVTLYKGFFQEKIGMAGTVVVFGVIFAACLGHMTYDNVARNLREGRAPFASWWQAWRESIARRRQDRQTRQADASGQTVVTRAAKSPTPPVSSKDPNKKQPDKAGAKEAATRPLVDDTDEPPVDQSGSSATPAGEEEAASKNNLPPPTTPPQGLKIIAGETVRKAAKPQPNRKGDYVLPPLSLLRDASPVAPDPPGEGHQTVAESIVRTLGEFGVKVTMGEVHMGPVITRYDVYPAAGVRVEKILNLDKNLALSLKALSVRILAPVPGRGCVGIEVPNKNPQGVVLRDILESEDWVNFKGEIPIALGKEVSGKPLITDLSRMPHLLIAGSTGAGKTVCINAIISSLIFRASPEDLRFVMVDPKIVEMQCYNSLPHMLIPVVTEPKKVPGALKYLLAEMERRYQLFASVSVRNIAGYNARMSQRKDADSEEKVRAMDAALSPEERAQLNTVQLPAEGPLDLPRKLPYIVFIIDELADLMMVAPADIETGIARLAQLARAAGIHLIIATQRPSVNVITGIIKANLPSRISFKVAARVDSRTILDTMGADQLIGRGDLLFLAPGTSDLVRAQGAYVSDEEINAVIEFLKQNGEPDIDELFLRSVEEALLDDGEDEGDGEEAPGEDDPLIPQAIEVIRTSKRASTSMLQRRMKIGYNRAARIMDILEGRGIVGPDNGSQPREILRDLDSL